MFYQPGKTHHNLPFDPFKACVVPRPIGWISTTSPLTPASPSTQPTHNLAPFSQFTNLSFDPPYVMFSANQTPEGFKKDTVRNVESTAKFVWNLATWDLREKVNASAQQLPFEVDEFEHVGLEKEFSSCLPGDVQNPVPMVRESPVKFECSYHSTLRLPGASVMGGVDLVIGKVEGVHIADWALSKEGKLDIGKTKPIARCGYYDYVVLDKTFEMVIPGGDKAILAGLEGNAEQAQQSMGHLLTNSRCHFPRIPEPFHCRNPDSAPAPTPAGKLHTSHWQRPPMICLATSTPHSRHLGSSVIDFQFQST